MPNPGHTLPDLGDTIISNNDTTPNPPKIVGGRYQIIAELGRGGFGLTYLAEDKKNVDGIPCVIKHFQPKFRDRVALKDAKQRFFKEAIVQQRLGNHEQIPQLIDSFEENDQFYLVQEFIDGEQLEAEIHRQVFSEKETISLLYDVLKVLEFVHKTKVIHRDVKPSNLIRRKSDGKIVLIDFGAVKEVTTTMIDARGDRVHTKLIGTEGYLPPEQRTGKPLFASDIYSLGRTAIYALCGRSPIDLEDAKTGEISNWRQYCQVSDKLAEIIDKAICPRYTERYHSAAEALHDLQPLLKLGSIVGGCYRLDRYIDGKEWSYTYLAENIRQQNHSHCLVKQLKPANRDLTTIDEVRKRFLTEPIILETLSLHAQIPQFLDNFEEKEDFYFVQEFIVGENLAQKILDRQYWNEQKVIQLLDEMLAILAFIHKHKIVHRNIKPTNVILSNLDGKIILTDFKLVEDIVHSSMSRTELKGSSRKLGKEAYTPPEQISGRATFSSDIYATGILAIQALTGTNPENWSIDAQTGEIIWRKGVEVNPKLAKILERMVCLDVGKRYQSVTKVLQDLHKIQPSSRLVSSQQPVPKTIVSSLIPWWRKLNLTYLSLGLLGGSVFLGSLEYINPTFRPLLYTYQGNQLLENKPEEAVSRFQKVIDLKPINSDAWLGRGEGLYQLKRFPEALSAFEEAIQLNSENKLAWIGKGDTLCGLERFQEAVTAYDRALKLDPENIEILSHKSSALVALEHYEEAFQVQDRVLKKEPNNPQTLSDRAITLMGLRKYYDALSAFNRVQVLSPNQPQLWEDKAIALRYLGSPQEALRIYNEALMVYENTIGKDPNNLNALIERGNILNKLERYSDAIVSFERAIDIDPESYLAWMGKGDSLAALAQHQQAIDAYNKAVDILPNSYMTLDKRGNVFRDGLKNYNAAMGDYDRAIAINSNYYRAWSDRGYNFIKLNQYEDAIKSFHNAIAINPHDHKSMVGKAIAFSSLGQQNQALKALETAIFVQSRDASIRLVQADILTKWGQYAKACDAYREASKIDPNLEEAIQGKQKLGCR